MRRSQVGALTGLLMAGGCGASPACQALVQGTHAENTLGAPCGHRSLVIDASDCPDWLRGCTPADQDLLETYGKCLTSLPTCSLETQGSWEQRVDDCGEPLSEVSAGCS